MKKPKSNKGLTLIELIISIAILGIILVPISGLAVNSMIFERESDKLLQANNIAQNCLESIKYTGNIQHASNLNLSEITNGVDKNYFRDIKHAELLNDFQLYSCSIDNTTYYIKEKIDENEYIPSGTNEEKTTSPFENPLNEYGSSVNFDGIVYIYDDEDGNGKIKIEDYEMDFSNEKIINIENNDNSTITVKSMDNAINKSINKMSGFLKIVYSSEISFNNIHFNNNVNDESFNIYIEKVIDDESSKGLSVVKEGDSQINLRFITKDESLSGIFIDNKNKKKVIISVYKQNIKNKDYEILQQVTGYIDN